MTAPSALRAFYDNVRLSVLERILNATPDRYRRSDAFFLAGQIYWLERRPAEAIATWRKMEPTAEDEYAKAASAVLDAIRRTAPARELDSIVAAERGRWVMFSIDRLGRFGYRLNTY